MNLWERELAPYEGALEGLSGPDRLALAIKAVEWSDTTMRDPIADPEARRWIDSALGAAREAVAAGAEHVTLSPDMVSDFQGLDESVEEYGVGQFMTGFMACADFDTLGVETLSNVLYICYEFAAQREDPEPETIEEQEANSRCREVIAFHKELIEQATA
ncbi:MAG: hypothetical protein ACRDK7_03260 [Solirubrobacteraceae bacterium]